jgi:hypothetical protein
MKLYKIAGKYEDGKLHFYNGTDSNDYPDMSPIPNLEKAVAHNKVFLEKRLAAISHNISHSLSTVYDELAVYAVHFTATKE